MINAADPTAAQKLSAIYTGQQPQAPPVDPMHALIAQLIAGMNQHQQGPDLGSILQGLHPAPRHLGADGGEITMDNPMGHAGGDPWKNGFFGPQTSSATGPALGPMQQASFDASRFQGPGTVLGQETPQFSTPPPAMGPQGVSGMVNPLLQGPAKLQDPNWWTAMPRVNSKGWKPGQVAR